MAGPWLVVQRNLFCAMTSSSPSRLLKSSSRRDFHRGRRHAAGAPRRRPCSLDCGACNNLRCRGRRGLGTKSSAAGIPSQLRGPRPPHVTKRLLNHVSGLGRCRHLQSARLLDEMREALDPPGSEDSPCSYLLESCSVDEQPRRIPGILCQVVFSLMAHLGTSARVADLRPLLGADVRGESDIQTSSCAIT